MLLMDVGKTRRKADLNGGSEEFILAHFELCQGCNQICKSGAQKRREGIKYINFGVIFI